MKREVIECDICHVIHHIDEDTSPLHRNTWFHITEHRTVYLKSEQEPYGYEPRGKDTVCHFCSGRCFLAWTRRVANLPEIVKPKMDMHRFFLVDMKTGAKTEGVRWGNNIVTLDHNIDSARPWFWQTWEEFAYNMPCSNDFCGARIEWIDEPEEALADKEKCK